jgi:hypothetical protein
MKEMKKQLLFVVSIVLTATFYAQNIPSYVPTNGLVGWWPFNGNANDESGNGNIVVLQGNASLAIDRYSVANSSYLGDLNSGADITSLSNFPFGNSERTISLWFQSSIPYPGGVRTLFAYGDNNSGGRFGLYMDGTSIGVEHMNGARRCAYTPDGIWHNFTVTYPSSGMGTNDIMLYFDGLLQSSSNLNPVSSLNTANSNIHCIGTLGFSPGWLYAFSGKIDDIAIYSRALTQEEITALYLGDCTKPSVSITPKSTTNIKENESVVLAATQGNGYTYAWYKDGITIASATDSNYTATTPGNYTVKISTSTTCDSTSAAVTVKRVYALPNYLPSNGLVGWWPFNGNANDESGNENHGTVNGAMLTSDRNRELNKAYNFNVSCVTIPLTKQIVTMPTRTISLWFETANAQSGGRLFEATNYSWGVGCYNSNQFDCWFQKGNQAYNFIGESYTKENQWSNLVFICDSVNQSKKIYLNGKIIKSDNPTANLDSPISNEWINHNLKIGQGISNESFYGGIDDIAIYNRALTQEEITALYLGEACTTPIATITPQSATSFCSGGSVNINAATNANYTYQWLNNKAPISTATTATYKATASGKYSVIVKNNSGCIDTSSVVTVTVTPTPSLPILTGPSTLCYNSKAIFKASIAGGTWGVANDFLLISSPQGLFRNNKMPPTNLYKTGVTYTLKSKDKLCSVTAQKSVWIRNVTATSITLTAAKQTLKVGEEVAATATTKITGNLLYWLSASTSVVGVTGTSSPYIAIVKGLRPATGANITFAVDDAAKGCRNAAFLPFTVTTAASLVDNESNTTTYTTDLNVYPNPSNGMVTIENIGDAKTISLIDVTGRVLKTTTVNADRMRLDYSTITKGNYFISIQGENLKEMKSIVIE